MSTLKRWCFAGRQCALTLRGVKPTRDRNYRLRLTSSRKSSPNQNTTKMRVPSESQLFRRAAREGVGPYGSTDAPSRPSWPMCWDTQRRRALSVTGLGNLHKFRRFPTESRPHWCRPARVTVYFRCQTYLLYLGGRIMLNVADGGVWAASRKHVDGCGVGRIPSETVEPKCKWVWRTQLAADPRPRSSPGRGGVPPWAATPKLSEVA